MKSNLLLDKIHTYQYEYKSLLESFLQLDKKHISEGLDEIRLFWMRRIDTVQLYLRSWFPGEDSYVFTASTYLDFDENEHLPFILFGEKHVLDDPLSRYVETYGNLSEAQDKDYLFEEITITAEDNLKILENLHDNILILPLRLRNQDENNHTLYDVGEKAFLGLFRGIESIKDYFSKCHNIDEIEKYACEDIGSMLLFSDDDNKLLPLKERFHAAVVGRQFIIDDSKPDSFNFFMLVFGYLQQAISVLASCLEYGCVPYIRDPVAFHYILFVLEKMKLTGELCSMRYKMSIAFAVYHICDKDKLSKIELSEFLRKSHEYDFSSKLYRCLDEHGINRMNYMQSSVAEIISDELAKFYKKLSARGE